MYPAIKHSLNSTLGTGSHKSLDKLITEKLNDFSAIKKIQRGSTIQAGKYEIEAVNLDKALIFSVSKGSAGYVAARGDITGSLKGNSVGVASSNAYSVTSDIITLSGNRTLSGGSTNLTVKEFSAVLADASHITCDGPVEWQIVEFS